MFPNNIVHCSIKEEKLLQINFSKNDWKKEVTYQVTETLQKVSEFKMLL